MILTAFSQTSFNLNIIQTVLFLIQTQIQYSIVYPPSDYGGYFNLNIEEECRTLLKNNKFEECRKLIEKEMAAKPDSPVPQNLLGLLEEKRFEKEKAIRHYRASYSLDPTYAPAIWNLQRIGTGDVSKKCAYTKKDCR